MKIYQFSGESSEDQKKSERESDQKTAGVFTSKLENSTKMS